MIGLAAAMLLILNGRIAGVSGILGGLLKPVPGDRGWRIAFIAGLIIGPLLIQLLSGKQVTITIDANITLLVTGGCWSASAPVWVRDAPAGMAFVVSHDFHPARCWPLRFSCLPVLQPCSSFGMGWPEMRNSIVAFVAGIVFSAGLTVSQMIDPAKVLGFLDVAGDWDASLALVMVGALVVMTIAWRLAGGRTAPFFADTFATPTRRDIDLSLLGGATVFGIGWGLVGLCPGPAISGIALGRWEVYLFVLAMLAGMTIHRHAPRKKRSG